MNNANNWWYFLTFVQLEALLQPEHLKSFLGGLGEGSLGSSSSSIVVPTDLDQAESKLEDKKDNKRKNKDISSEDDSGDDENGVTMIKLPLELNLQEVSCIFIDTLSKNVVLSQNLMTF